MKNLGRLRAAGESLRLINIDKKQGGQPLTAPLHRHRPDHGGTFNLPMTDSEVLNTFRTAEQHGGNFMTHLARAGIAADPINRAKLLRTWPEIYQTYGPGSALYKEAA